ncbi:MAG: hypothetical protein HQK87_08890 [Nitrospinae bacterium]|nr:hypothetical protein [Nitrospinota bacterium]
MSHFVSRARAALVGVGGALALLVMSASGVMAQGVKINEKGLDQSKVCLSCHGDIGKRWKESMHARSTSDPIFVASYYEAHYRSGGKAEKLCLRCHAPTAAQTGATMLDDIPATDGISCDFCHSVKDLTGNPEKPFVLDLGVTKYGPNKKGDVKQHTVAYSELHGKADFCASCHEYKMNGVGIMTTFSEWKESVYAEEGKPCQSCHMPEVKGRVADGVTSERGEKVFSHDLAGSHSIAQLKKALALKITRIDRKDDRMTVSVDLTNSGSGHRVPTGIPSRKLILTCEVKAPGGKVFQEKVVYEKVLFDADGYELDNDARIMLGEGRSVAKDNRIFPKETRKETFTFYIPKNKRADVSVRVDYLYKPRIIEETEMRIEMNRDGLSSGN